MLTMAERDRVQRIALDAWQNDPAAPAAAVAEPALRAIGLAPTEHPEHLSPHVRARYYAALAIVYAAAVDAIEESRRRTPLERARRRLYADAPLAQLRNLAARVFPE